MRRAGRIAKRVGEEIHSELFGPDAAVEAASSAPANPAELLVFGGDGSRYRTNEADKPRRTKDTPPEDRGWPAGPDRTVVRTLRAGEQGRRGTGVEGEDRERWKLHRAHRTREDLRRDDAQHRGIRPRPQDRGRPPRTRQRSRNRLHPGQRPPEGRALRGGLPAMVKREFGDADVNCVTDFFRDAERRTNVGR